MPAWGASFRYDARVNDKGWVLSRATGKWELLGPAGEIIDTVTAAYVELGGAGLVSRRGARLPRLWPPLLPGRPYLHCVLTGGPAGGPLHGYLDPGQAAPELLLVRGQVFRLAVHCGHRACPYHYAAAEHTG